MERADKSVRGAHPKLSALPGVGIVIAIDLSADLTGVSLSCMATNSDSVDRTMARALWIESPARRTCEARLCLRPALPKLACHALERCQPRHERLVLEDACQHRKRHACARLSRRRVLFSDQIRLLRRGRVDAGRPNGRQKRILPAPTSRLLYWPLEALHAVLTPCPHAAQRSPPIWKLRSMRFGTRRRPGTGRDHRAGVVGLLVAALAHAFPARK